MVPRSTQLQRILTAPPLESLGTAVAMAYDPVGTLWKLGLSGKSYTKTKNMYDVEKYTSKEFQSPKRHHQRHFILMAALINLGNVHP